MGNLRETAQKVKQAVERIKAAKANPQQLDQAIAEATQCADQLVQDSQKD